MREALNRRAVLRFVKEHAIGHGAEIEQLGRQARFVDHHRILRARVFDAGVGIVGAAVLGILTALS